MEKDKSHMDEFHNHLQNICAQQLGHAEIDNLTRLSAGASQEIWSFEAGGKAYIVRRPPNGVSLPADRRTKISLSDEAHLLHAVYKAGGKVPQIAHIFSETDGLGEGYIMQFVKGETLGARIARGDEFTAIRPQLATQCGTHLAHIHAMNINDLPEMPLSYGEMEIETYEQILRQHAHPHPVFELALRWLKDNLPEQPTNPHLVHGDFRNGNIIFDPQHGIQAILDWELAHLGDPMEDLGWICVTSWRFGNIDFPIGGFGQREDFYHAYEQAGGNLNRASVRFWEILGTLKWGIMCTMMADTFTSGREKTIERAAIGRRASETEIDLLRLLLEQD